MGKAYQDEDMSASCISSEPMMQGDVSSSTLRAFQPKEDEEDLHLDETEAHERSLRASLVKMCAMLVFMLASFVAISAPGSAEALLRSTSERLLNGVRARGRIPGGVYIVLHALDKTHLALGSAAAVILGTVIYVASRMKQKKENTTSAESNAIEENRAEMQCDKNDVVRPPVCPGSSPTGANLDSWTPISGLEVKLEFEYSPGEMSSSEKNSPPQNRIDTTQKRRPRRKNMSIITHNVVTRDSSVGSSPSYDKSRAKEDKAEAILRRSSRIRNKAMSPPSGSTVKGRCIHGMHGL